MGTLFMMLLGIGVGRFFPVSQKEKNELVQLLCTLLLIFSMGVGLGQRDSFFSELLFLGIQSFLFFLLPTLCSIVFVYFLTRHFMAETDKETDRPSPCKESASTPKKKRSNGIYGSWRTDSWNWLRNFSHPIQFFYSADFPYAVDPVSADVLSRYQHRTSQRHTGQTPPVSCKNLNNPLWSYCRIVGRRSPMRVVHELPTQSSCLYC